MESLVNLAYQYRNMIWIGVRVTIIVSVLSVLLGFIFGTLVCFMKISKNKVINTIGTVYVEIIRGTPVLLQIAMVYYGLPLMGLHIPSITFLGFSVDKLVCGILALTINSSAYVSEIVRSGIQSIDKGQREAALSLGLEKPDVMRFIIMPQAIKNILPALGNEFVNLIKTSSQVSIIGLADLMYTANVIRGNSFRPFAPLVIVAVLYLVLTFSTSSLVRNVEKRFNRSSAN